MRYTSWANEVFAFWNQLSNAGLIAGNFTGVGANNGADILRAAPGENVPSGKRPNLVWSTYFNLWQAGASDWYVSYDMGNILEPQFPGTSPTVPIGQPAFTPMEAKSIDQKIDDSMPGTGAVRIGNWLPCTLSTSNSDTGKDYELTNSGTVCNLLFHKWD